MLTRLALNVLSVVLSEVSCLLHPVLYCPTCCVCDGWLKLTLAGIYHINMVPKNETNYFVGVHGYGDRCIQHQHGYGYRCIQPQHGTTAPKKPKVLVCMVMKNRLRRVTVMHISMEVK